MASARRWLGLLLIQIAAVNAAAEPLSVLDAVRTGDHGALRQLLRAGADPNERHADGSLPLAWAIDRQDSEAVLLLLRHKAWVDDPNPKGNDFRPLFVACLHPEPAILEALLDAGASSNTRGPSGIPALSPCAARASLTTVERLLAEGADPNAVDDKGQTPLMWAAQAGRQDSFDRLLSAGAKLNARSNAGLTPTMFAVKSGSAATARRALSAGADAAQTTPDGTTLVQLAMYQGNYRFAEDLIRRGSDLEAYDRNGHQLLHAAVRARQPELVALLLERGASVDAPTRSGTVQWRYESNFKAGHFEFPQSTALLLAAERGDSKLMRVLLDADADATTVNGNGETVTLLAAGSGEADALGIALAAAGGANDIGVRGESPLHRVLGTAKGDTLETMLKLLASYGAQPELKNAAGKSARQLGLDRHFKGRDLFERIFGAVDSARAAHRRNDREG